MRERERDPSLRLRFRLLRLLLLLGCFDDDVATCDKDDKDFTRLCDESLKISLFFRRRREFFFFFKGGMKP